MILEGRVEVKAGQEQLVFESGPFTHFGLNALAGAAAVDLNDDKGWFYNSI